MKQNKAIIGIDLGGTKLAIGSVDINVEKDKPIYYLKLKTLENNDPISNRTKLDHFLQRMKEGIEEVILKTQEMGFEVLPRIGMGSPGNIKDGLIVADTTPQLGSAFNNLNIEQALMETLKDKQYKIVIRNDALAQMAYGIKVLSKKSLYKSLFHNQKICYLGLGTGLGGGFAHISIVNNNKIKFDFFTDGHVGDIVMEDNKQAENDMLSGLFLKNKYNLQGIDLAQNIDKYQKITYELGENLGKIIAVIHSGEVYKVRSSTMWNDEDRQRVKGISIFVIGGSMGCRGEISDIIIRKANSYLFAHWPQKQIKIIPIDINSAYAGILGASNFV